MQSFKKLYRLLYFSIFRLLQRRKKCSWHTSTSIFLYRCKWTSTLYRTFTHLLDRRQHILEYSANNDSLKRLKSCYIWFLILKILHSLITAAQSETVSILNSSGKQSLGSLRIKNTVVCCIFTSSKRLLVQCPFFRVSVQGVESLWGDCMFIPADWGS